MTDNQPQPLSQEEFDQVAASVAGELNLTKAEAKKLEGESYDDILESGKAIVAARKPKAVSRSKSEDDDETESNGFAGEFIAPIPDEGITWSSRRFS